MAKLLDPFTLTQGKCYQRATSLQELKLPSHGSGALPCLIWKEITQQHDSHGIRWINKLIEALGAVKSRNLFSSRQHIPEHYLRSLPRIASSHGSSTPLYSLQLETSCNEKSFVFVYIERRLRSGPNSAGSQGLVTLRKSSNFKLPPE